MSDPARMTDDTKESVMSRVRFDWFGWHGRKGMPARGPWWFVARCANFLYISLGGYASLTLPWFWHHGAIESRGYDKGWLAGYEAGSKTAAAKVPR